MNEPHNDTDQPLHQTSLTRDDAPTASSVEVHGGRSHASSKGCRACGASEQPEDARRSDHVTPSYVYAIGRVHARFPNLAAEKEFAQATGRTETAGKTDQQTFHAVLAKRENRYLVRQLCWVLNVQGFETYLLVPRDPADVELLVESIRPAPDPNDIDVVIGMRGPIAPPQMCNGLMVPVVVFDQIYSFDRETSY